MLFSRFVFWSVLAFGAGIFFTSFFFSSVLLILFVLAAGIMLLSVFWGKWRVARAGFFLILFSLGMAHYVNAVQLPSPLSEPKEVSFAARVAAGLTKDETGSKIVVQPLQGKGKVLLFASLFEQVREGDMVLVSGKVQSPSLFEDFNYPLYLAKDGIFWIMFRPTIELQEHQTPFLSRFRDKLKEQADTALSLPESSLLAALLLGDKAGLPEELKADLQATGTRHITAISGMHVAILSGMLFSFLLNSGVHRKKSSLLVLLFLAFFVMFTGWQTSAVRAGIMGSTFFAAGLFGRANVSLRILVFAAVGMLTFNPLLLAHDIGFQLSFLAVLGILLFLPVFQYFFSHFPNRFGLRDVVFMSIAAQLFTLPLILHHFQILSVVSLATNLLVVPFLPLILLSGVAFLFLSILLPILSSFFVFPVALLLSYLLFVITVFSELPFAAYQVQGFPLWVAFLLLAPVSFFAWKSRQEQRFRFREETMLL